LIDGNSVDLKSLRRHEGISPSAVLRINIPAV